MRIVAAIVIACATCANAQPSEPLLDAIRQVESGGRDLTGDGGRAIGPYQIHRRYWQDAVRLDPSLGGTYNDCRREQYARRVVRVYLAHYGKGKTDEQMARIHNGGPTGHRKRATVGYWTKIRRVLGV
jgi:hypothetical protein